MPSYTLVLISSSAQRAVPAAQAREVFGDLAGAAATILADGIAAEATLVADLDEATAVKARLMAAVADAPVDVALLPAAGRRKRLLVADMDSTIIGQECIDEMADLVGRKPEIAAITERAMRGELAFETALRERLAVLSGIAVTDIERLLTDRITLNPGARTLLATMRAKGAVTALVSGGFTLFTRAVAQRAGFDRHYANQLVLEQGRTTGAVAAPVLGPDAKRDRLLQLAEQHAIAISETLAVGDGANDLAMLATAGLGVAYHAKPVVAAKAHVALTHADLTGLLYLQGYPQADHVFHADHVIHQAS